MNISADHNKGLKIGQDNIAQDLVARQTIIIKTPTDQFSFPITVDGETIHAELGKYAIYKETLNDKGRAMHGDITVTVKTNEPFIIQCPFEINKNGTKPYFMIPGFLYGSNNIKTSDGKQPKFDYEGKPGFPNSSVFYTRSDRSSHPGVITVKDKWVMLVGIREKMEDVQLHPADKWSPGYLYTGLMVDSSHKDKDVVGFQIGYEHKPQRYSWVWDDPPTPQNNEYLHGWIAGMEGKALHTKTFYYLDEANGIPDYGKALRAYYHVIHQSPVKRAGRQEAIQKVADALVNDGYNKQNNFFHLADNEDGREVGDMAWTGGMQVAWPLLKAGVRLQDKQAINTACTFMDNACENAFHDKAGLLYEEFRDGAWQIDGWWGVRENCYNWGDHPLHSAYINGQASYYLLKAYLLMDKKHKAWLDTAQKVIDTVIRSQREDGAFAKFFDPETGAGHDYDGFQSCWFVPGAALLSVITGKKEYLNSAERAIPFYLQWFERGELYGTPMDTHEAVDEEGNLAFLAACAELHKATNKQQYIDYAWYGLDWEFTWKFAYNTAFTNEPLKSMNWSSSGGSITSTHNPSIHQMGNLAAIDIYYFYQQTNDQYLAERLRDTCIWGLGTFNCYDGEFGFGKTGHGTEQFFYSDGLLLPWWNAWDGGVWQAYLTWAPACVLLSSAEDIPDAFFE